MVNQVLNILQLSTQSGQVTLSASNSCSDAYRFGGAVKQNDQQFFIELYAGNFLELKYTLLEQCTKYLTWISKNNGGLPYADNKKNNMKNVYQSTRRK